MSVLERFKTLSAICICILLFLIPQESYSSHSMGVDLEYTCLGGNQYRFRLALYRDCAGSSMSSTVTVNLASATCTNASVVLTQVGVATEVSPLCPTQIGNSTCNGGTLPGVEQYIYEGTYTFSQNCNDWNISYTLCCRNNMITNLASASSQSMYVNAELDNTLPTCNNSPSFTTLPVPYICINQTFCYNHGAVDPDGDSLVYSLINAMTTGGGLITYNAPNTPTYPITTSSGVVSFDQATGSMCITPSVAQVAVVSVRVDEYRNGVKIGSTMRDLQIVVQSCANAQPAMTSGGITNLTGGGAIIDSNSVELCPGTNVTYDVVFQDVNAGDNITITTNLATSIPGATFTVTGSNPATGRFSWTPTALDIGFYVYTITVQDDGCPILGSQVYAFDINVLDGTYAGPDRFYCPAGGPLPINAAGGSIFTWNTLAGDPGGLSCTNCPNPLASPSVTSTYEVVSNLSSTCKNRDTVTVNVVPDFTLTTGPDQTICKYGTANLTSTAGPGTFAPYTFNWSPGATLSSTSAANPVANPTSTTMYYLSTTSSAGCTIRDSVEVTISGVAPQVVINAPDTFCDGISTAVTTFISYECDTTSTPCTGPANNGSIGSGSSASSTYGPHYMFVGSPYSTRHQYIFTRAELEAMGFVGGGRLNSIALYYATANSTANGVAVRVGCTTRDQWDTAPFNFETGLTEVKAPTNLTPTLGWNNIVFDYPYNWDGVSNLVVEFCRADTMQGTSSNVAYECSSPVAYRTMYSLMFNSPTACSSVSGSRTSCRPHMRFNWCEALPGTLNYAWTPTTGVSNPNIPNPSITATSTTTYTFTVTDGSCAGADFHVMEVAPQFSLNAGPDTTLCRNVPTQLSPTVGGGFTPYRYAWTPSTGLTCTTCPTPSATPDNSTAYALAVTSSAGCTMLDTVNINISGVAPLVSAGQPDTICQTGDSTVLNPFIAYNCGPTSFACSGPANTGQIGAGLSATTTYSPHYMFTSSPYSIRRQFIFTRAELENMGFIGGGRISAIGLDYSTANDVADDITISMGCTSRDQWDTTPYEFETGLTVVKNLFSHTPTTGVNTFNFDTPYMWDGISNLVVEFCTSDTNTGIGSSVFYECLSPIAYRTLYYSMFNGDSACTVVTGTRTSCRPNMRFTYCEALPGGLTYNWTPGTGLSSTTSQNPVATPTVTTTYQFNVFDGSGCDGLGLVTVEVDSSMYVTGTANDYTPCVGDAVSLNAAVTGTPGAIALPFCGANGTVMTEPPVNSQVAGGTFSGSTTTYSPFYGTYSDHKVQYLIYASELAAAGVPSGTFTNISFNVTTKNSSRNYRNLRVGMGCTNLTSMSLLSGWQPVTNVFGPSNYTSVLGANNFTLAAPFDWDGSSNLIIEVCYDNNNTDAADAVSYTSGLGYNATLRNGVSSGGTDGCTIASAWTYTARPVFDFTVVPPPPATLTYSWSPSTGLSGANTANPTVNSFGGGLQTYTVTISGGNCAIVDTVSLIECGVLSAGAIELFGERAGAHAKLEWLTTDEDQTQWFGLERMDVNGNFKEIARQPAGGTTQGQSQYFETDFAPLPGINTYRVMVLSANGEVGYSNPVEILFEDVEGVMEVYPNPVQPGQSVFIEYLANDGGAMTVTFTDLLGRTVGSTVQTVSPGRNKLEVPTEQLSEGTYFVTTSKGTEVHSVKLLVVR